MQRRLSEEINDKEFTPIKTGLLGNNIVFAKQEVLSYLESLVGDIEQMEKEKKILERKIELLDSQNTISSELKGRSLEELQQFEKELVERAKQVERMEKSFKRMVLIAEDDAENIREEATKEAKEILSGSKRHAEDLLRKAKNKLDESQAEAETIITEAKERRQFIDNRYQEIKAELINIHNFIEKSVFSEKELDKSLFSEKAKQAVVND
jgi:cell division initiation protein